MADDSDAAEAARLQAEARRKRILEKAQKRMGKVSGEVGQDIEDKKEAEAKAARIKAARQRRYGKKTKDSEKEASDTSGTKSNEEETAAVATSEVSYEEPETDVARNSGSVDGIDDGKEDEDTKNDVSVSDKEVEDSTEATEPKKKYLGVAKMRRKMIMKKKTGNDDATTDTKTSTAIDADVKLKPKTPVVKLPIYMHAITVILLFVAGVDVGVQQYHDDVNVHGQLSLKEHGVPFIHRNPWPKQKSASGVDSLIAEISASDYRSLDNEFETENLQEVADSTLDPLFGVDLDELTSGPGFLNRMGRGAVSVHRFLLKLFFYGPISIFRSILSLPTTLLEAPPLLCLIALILRQIVGKRILYAGIPEPESDDKDSGVDVLAMVKKGLKNYISTSFPTAVGAYDMFSHLRSDMYVVICGVFVGLVWSHSPGQAIIAEGIIEMDGDTPDTNIADEL